MLTEWGGAHGLDPTEREGDGDAPRTAGQDEDSGKSGCPAVYLAEDGSLVVQGNVLDTATHGNLENVLAGESAMRIKLEIVVEALRRYHERRP